jgi:hypothetical protein
MIIRGKSQSLSLAELRLQRSTILGPCRQARGFECVRLRLCGARRSDSDYDVDFLVDMELGRSLLDLGGLLTDLVDMLDRKWTSSRNIASESDFARASRPRRFVSEIRQ